MNNQYRLDKYVSLNDIVAWVEKMATEENITHSIERRGGTIFGSFITKTKGNLITIVSHGSRRTRFLVYENAICISDCAGFYLPVVLYRELVELH